MLSLDPNQLAQEVRYAEEFRRRHTLRLREINARFVGNWYRVDQIATATPENSVFAFIAFMLPTLWYANPSCRIQARRPQTHAAIAEAMESAVRGWFTETTFTQDGQDVVRDALIGYGVMQVGIEPRDFPGDGVQQHNPEMDGQQPGMLSGAMRPFAVRVPPEQLILDPVCDDFTKARFIGHSYYKDLDQVQAEAEQMGYDAEAVDSLTSVPRDGDVLQRQEQPLLRPQTADRNRVNLVDLWIRERGVIVTLARCNEASNSVLRQISYFGPPEGPYEVYGFYTVPGDPYPMSPLQPIMEQLEEMWAHQRQASEDAALYKKFVLVEENDPNLQSTIVNAKGGGVYPVRGLTNFQVVEMGGTPEGRLAHIASLRDRADRTSGVSDAQRGLPQGKTATESSIVQGNVDTRTSYLRQRVQWHTTRVLSRVCWYFFFDDTIVMPVTMSDPFSGAVTEGTFLGGIQPGQDGMGWVDFHLTIEPTSMGFSDDGQLQQRGMLLMQVAQEIGQMLVQMPYANWRLVTNTIGDSININNLFDVLFNQQIIQQFMQIPQAFGMGGPVPLPGGANPALSAQGLGVPNGPAPQWGQALPPGAAGGMASGFGGGGGGGATPGAMPGRPGMMMSPGGAGGGSPFAMARPGGMLSGNPRSQQQSVQVSRRPAGKPLSGNPRSNSAGPAPVAAPAVHTGNPRAAKRAAMAGAK